MVSRRPPEQGPAFEALMSEIDAKLIAERADIPARPMLAMGEISLRYEISIPIASPRVRLPPELQEHVGVSDSINRWYKESYGDRLKTDPCPGETVVLLDGDLYVLRIPRIYGSVRFILTREWLDTPGIGRGTALCNITQLVDEMTAAKAARLSESALDAIGKAFHTALPAVFTLEATEHNLISIAQGDVKVAVSNLMAREGRFGESKWSSLQAAEKVLKAAIDLAGVKFKFTHGLAELCKTLNDTGITFDASAEVGAIQCKPGIRYGEEPCSREEALLAHQASLELVNIVRDAGAKLSMGIGGLRSGE